MVKSSFGSTVQAGNAVMPWLKKKLKKNVFLALYAVIKQPWVTKKNTLILGLDRHRKNCDDWLKNNQFCLSLKLVCSFADSYTDRLIHYVTLETLIWCSWNVKNITFSWFADIHNADIFSWWLGWVINVGYWAAHLQRPFCFQQFLAQGLLKSSPFPHTWSDLLRGLKLATIHIEFYKLTGFFKCTALSNEHIPCIYK